MENLNNTDKASENAERELRISDVIQRFIRTERDRLEDRRQFYLKQKGDYSFHNLQSIQGQMGVINRLEKEFKNVL